MGSKGDQFAGLTGALVTPFADGAGDETALRALVDFHAESATDCISPVGTTGESPTLSHDEHEQVIRIVCEQAAVLIGKDIEVIVTSVLQNSAGRMIFGRQTSPDDDN